MLYSVFKCAVVFWRMVFDIFLVFIDVDSFTHSINVSSVLQIVLCNVKKIYI